LYRFAYRSPCAAKKALRAEQADGEASAIVRTRVEHARQSRLQRAGKLNSALSGKELNKTAALDDECRNLVEQAVDRFGLSARAYHRIQRVARTIADVAGREKIETAHVAEAIQYRTLDRRMVCTARFLTGMRVVVQALQLFIQVFQPCG